MQNTTPAAAPSGSTTASAADPSPSTPDGFKRVDDDAPQMQSGEALLVEAYAFIWVVIFGLVLLTWLRQRRLDARMNELESAIAAARNQRPLPNAPARDAASDDKGA